MQKFTRALTREIEVGGERLAVTLSNEGLSVRPVGSRRPPHTMSWAACLLACVQHGKDPTPTHEQIEQVIKAMRGGGPRTGASAAEEVAGPAGSEAPPPPAPASRTVPAPTDVHPSLTTLLGKIDHWLREHRPRFHESLLPGASPGDCEHLATTLGIRLPEDLRAWLTWHNGQNPDVPGALEQSWILMSVQEIIDAKKELDEQAHKGWEKHWLPLLDDDNGNYLCVDVATPHLPVLEGWRGREDHPVISPALAAWAHDFLTALEKGEYTEDPERGAFLRRQSGHAEKPS